MEENKEEVKEAPAKPKWKKTDLPMKEMQIREMEAKVRDINFKVVHQETTVKYIKENPNDALLSSEYSLEQLKIAKKNMEEQIKLLEKQKTEILRNGV